MPTIEEPGRFEPPPVAPTGIPGLDEVLHGGLPREEMHLLQGVAGTGKTTIALRFLRAGSLAGEPGLYLTLSQSKAHLERIARSHGWSVEGMVIHELSPGTVASRVAARQTVLPTADVELGELFRDVSDLVARVKPRRAVIDSLAVLQMLAGSAQRYHREVVTLRQLFVEQHCTLLVITDHPAATGQGIEPEPIFHPLSGCVIDLSHEARTFGVARRRLRIVKARGLPSSSGYHDLKIRTGEIVVYPRLKAYEQPEHVDDRKIPTGISTLDRMLGGGVELGTSCLIVGASGIGKSTIATRFATALASPESRASVYLFDERPATWIGRAEGLGSPVRAQVEAGHIRLRQLDPGEIAPGEFAQQVVDEVTRANTKVVVIDSLVGYFAAMGASDVLITQLHELLTFLTRKGVLLVMCGSQEGFMSIGKQELVDVSYLSDTILALSFFETNARLRRAIAVAKKKHGDHSHEIHELFLVPGRVEVGNDPLSGQANLMVPPAPPRHQTGT